jgi:flagellar basal-body rod protein FlgG
MDYGIYLSAAGLQVNQYRMEVLANNLANADTPGFKHDLTVVQERQPESRERMAGFDASEPSLAGLTGGSLVAPTHTSFEQGPIEMTSRPLDVALTGDGFFRVQDGDQERYTRDGRFMINANGELLTSAGFHPVLDENGSPIVVDTEAKGAVQIHGNGELRAGKASFGKLGVVDFEDKSLLRKAGGNLIQAMGATPESITGNLQVGAIEKSTVDPTRSLVSMIEVNRAYQLNATLIGLADTMLSRAVNDIGRIR